MVSMTVESLGKLVLVMIIAIAVIVFIIVAATGQVNVFNQTGTSIVGNLSGKAQETSSGIVIK